MWLPGATAAVARQRIQIISKHKVSEYSFDKYLALFWLVSIETLSQTMTTFFFISNALRGFPKLYEGISE